LARWTALSHYPVRRRPLNISQKLVGTRPLAHQARHLLRLYLNLSDSSFIKQLQVAYRTLRLPSQFVSDGLRAQSSGKGASDHQLHPCQSLPRSMSGPSRTFLGSTHVKLVSLEESLIPMYLHLEVGDCYSCCWHRGLNHCMWVSVCVRRNINGRFLSAHG
jgi:hypothetical protein